MPHCRALCAANSQSTPKHFEVLPLHAQPGGHMELSWNGGISKSSILMGCSIHDITNQPFWDTPFMIFMETPIYSIESETEQTKTGIQLCHLSLVIWGWLFTSARCFLVNLFLAGSIPCQLNPTSMMKSQCPVSSHPFARFFHGFGSRMEYLYAQRCKPSVQGGPHRPHS